MYLSITLPADSTYYTEERAVLPRELKALSEQIHNAVAANYPEAEIKVAIENRMGSEYYTDSDDDTITSHLREIVDRVIDDGNFWGPEIDSDNEIDVETFLLGGEFGGPYNRQYSEGFHCLTMTNEAPGTYEEFRKAVEICVEEYVWDTNRPTTLFASEYNTGCQRFEMPPEDQIRAWWDELQTRRAEEEAE